MATLWEQRQELVQANTDLIVQWLSLLDEQGKRDVIASMVRHFSLTELRLMHEHVSEQVQAASLRKGA